MNRFKFTIQWLAALGLLLLITLIAQKSFAEEQTEESAETKNSPLPIEMTTKVEGHEGYPGDPIKLIVTFTSDKPFAADILGNIELEGFEYRDRNVFRGEEEGKEVVRHTIVMTRFKPGTYETPQLPFVLKQAGKQEERAAKPVRVIVKSLLEEEAKKIALQQAKDKGQKGAAGKKQGAKILPKGQGQPNTPTFNLPPGSLQPGQPQDPNQPRSMGSPNPARQKGQEIQLQPRDIKNPLPLIEEDYTLLYVALVFLGLVLIAFGVWLYLAKRKPKEAEEEAIVIDTRPAHVIALERLTKLEARQYIAKRKLKPFHLELTEILKDYFERRYAIDDALSFTSEEIVERLEGLYLKDLDERVVREVLFQCDMVNFAKYDPSDEACFDKLEKAKMIVERTKKEEASVGVS